MSSAKAEEKPDSADRKLKILHVLRAPVGGLFRHVQDLAAEQVARGHAVGLVTDSNTGGDKAVRDLAALSPSLELGVLRLPMLRRPDPRDLAVALTVGAHARKLGVDILHGHGAKGGVYARCPQWHLKGFAPTRIYTPHGGSFSMTLRPWAQSFYMFIERLLEPFTDAYLFESSFVAERFAEKIGKTQAVTRIVPNGIAPEEFTRVEPVADAADFLYVGELRWQKGIDLLIEAMSQLTYRYSKPARLLMVGSGPDREKFIARTQELGLNEQVRFIDPMPAREAFKLGRVLVLPSRSESFPYIILEAAGAQLPIIATNVGDIGKLLEPNRGKLIAANDLEGLIAALIEMLETPPAEREAVAARTAAYVSERFSRRTMANAILSVYRETRERNTATGNHHNSSYVVHS